MLDRSKIIIELLFSDGSMVICYGLDVGKVIMHVFWGYKTKKRQRIHEILNKKFMNSDSIDYDSLEVLATSKGNL